MATETHKGHEMIQRPTNKVAIVLALITAFEVLLGIFLGPDVYGHGADTIIALKQFVYILLIIALLAKASLVVTYYMGLKYEEHRREILIFVILVPLTFVFLFILLPVVGLTSGTPRLPTAFIPFF